MRKAYLIILLLVSNTFSKEFVLNLNQAIELALKNNALNKISKLNLQVANAQYKQALSANYPSLDAVLYANRNDKNDIYQQRGSIAFPSDLKGILNGIGITGLPSSLNADMDTIAKGRDTVKGQIELNYPLYTGGKISSIIEQARLNKNIAKQTIIRDESSIIFDVRKYFYAYMLSNELFILMNSIHENMKFSTDLAKEFLENGSDLKIKKTDYLSAKLTTSLINSTLSKIELNKKMIEGAIGNIIGLKYDDIFKIKYKKQELLKQNLSLQELVKKAYSLNPDINSINIALKIKDQQIKESSSGNKPMVNLFGNVSHTYNSYEYGYLNDDNENRWSLGLAIKLSLFDGFKIKNEVFEKRIDKRIVGEQKVLLEEGLALQLKNEFLKSSVGYKQIEILKDAVKTARENSRMNLKGFQYEIVEAKDLIQSQLLEVYVKGDYLKTVHDYLLSLATIDKLVGIGLRKKD